MITLWQDIRYGLRMLRRSPGFTTVAILTLAIGIGANAAIFSILNRVVLNPLSYPDSNRLVVIWETDANRNIYRGTASPAELLDWRDMSHSFQELSGWRALFYTVTGNAEPEQVWGAQASGNFFRMLGVAPALGRDFSSEDEQPGHGQVVILDYGYWQRHYGGDRGVIGKTMALDGKPYVIIGVLPSGFSLFGRVPESDLWTPFAFNRAQLNREDHELIVFGRLRRGVTLGSAQAEMATILAQLKRQYPGIDQKNGVRVASLHDEVGSKLRPALLLLFAAVGFVLLIACANIANLMIARASSREREIAVRAALGAGRARILRQLLTESMLLAILGGAFGVAVAYGGLLLVQAIVPLSGTGQIPRLRQAGVGGEVLLFIVVVSLLTGILFGLVPALQVSRTRLHESLKEGSRGSTSSRRSRLAQSVLVVSEIALSLVLLAGAGLLIRSFVRMMSQNLGFDPSHVLTMQVFLPQSHYPDSAGPRMIDFYQQVLDKVSSFPGVQSASAIDFLPLTGWSGFCDFDIQGRATPPSDEHFTGQYRVIDWHYLRTMRIPLKEGRNFSAADGSDSEGVVMLNEALAERYWPNQDPIGQRIRLQLTPGLNPWTPETRAGWLTVVGIVGDIEDWQFAAQKTGQLYLPYTQNPSRIMRLVVRSNGDPAALTSGVRQAVVNADPSQPVTDVSTMDEYLAQSLSSQRVSMWLLAVFAGIATALAVIGVYGLMAYGVARRAHEIGIRMAVGAEPADVLQMIVRDGMRLVGIGLVAGLLCSFALTRYLRSQLYGIEAHDPLTLLTVTAGLIVVAFLSCYIPARRATKVDPLVALRYE
ncbi:MAG: ABC transporter permease [Candidatus Acidiferrales bacterium]